MEVIATQPSTIVSGDQAIVCGDQVNINRQINIGVLEGKLELEPFHLEQALSSFENSKMELIPTEATSKRNQTNITGDQYNIRQQTIINYPPERREEAKLADEWEKRLKDKYKRDRKKIRFGRGKHAIADTDDIFVNLSLISQKEIDTGKDIDRSARSSYEEVQLNSYLDLLALTKRKDEKDEPCSHVLLRGVAGSGKTTLLARIAYEWATDIDSYETNSQNKDSALPKSGALPKSSWNKFKLLFLLEIKRFKSGKCLEHAIKSQLLPGVYEESIASVINCLGIQCLILLDGFDEMPSDIDDTALCSPLLGTSFVIVTTRPHMVDQFCVDPDKSGFAHVQISGFNTNSSSLYIRKYFDMKQKPDLGSNFIQKVNEIPLLRTLSSFPILLVMMCLLWEDSCERETPFKSITALYQEAIIYLNKPFITKCRGLITNNIESILERLGKPALDKLFDNNLQISSKEFDDLNALEKSFQIGLTYEEEYDVVGESSVYFIHKTFQEFCAAKYLTSLVETDKSEFNSSLHSIQLKNVFEMEYLLRFSCGLNIVAAELILSHVVNIMVESVKSEAGNNVWYLPLMLLYEVESNKMSTTDPNLYEILEPLGDSRLIVSLRHNEYGFAFNYFASSWKSGICSWLKMVKSFLLQWCTLSINKLLMYLSAMKAVQKLYLCVADITEGSNCDTYCFKSIKKFTMSNSSVTTNALLSLLNSMPVLRKVRFTSVRFQGKLHANMPIQCESIQEFTKVSGSVDANTMAILLNCLISLQTLTLQDVNFQGDTMHDLEQLKTIKEFSMSLDLKKESAQCIIDSRRVFNFLECMNSLEKLTLHNVHLSEEIYITGPYNALREVKISGWYKQSCKVNDKSLIRFLNCSPGLKQFILNEVEISGDLQISEGIELPVLTQTEMKDVRVSACTLVVLLMRSARSLNKLSLDGVNLSGKFDPNITISGTTFHKKELKLSTPTFHRQVTANALVNHLSRFPYFEVVTLNQIDLKCEFQPDVSDVCKSVKTFNLFYDGTVGSELIIKLLGTMPSLEKVCLSVVNLTNESDTCVSISLNCLREAKMGAIQRANTLHTYLASMPSLETLHVDGYFTGTMMDGCTSNLCNVLKTFHLKGLHPSSYDELCLIPGTTLVSYLNCMQSLQQLELYRVHVKNDTGEDTLPIRQHLTELNIYLGIISADLLAKFVCSMPVLKRLVLHRVDITGEMTFPIEVPCSTITELDMSASTVNINTLLKLLGYMPSLQKITLGRVNNQVSTSSVQSCESIKEFNIRNITTDAMTLMILLSRMPLVKKAELTNICLTGELQETFACKSLTNLKMIGGSITTKTLLKLMGCMSSLVSTEIKQLQLTGDIVEHIPVFCNSLKNFHLSGVEVRANTFARYISCMPSLTSISVDRITGDLDPNIRFLCKKLEVLSIFNSELSARALQRFLSFMPFLQRITFQSFDVHGVFDASVSDNLKSVTILQLTQCKISTTMLFQFLEIMPSLKDVAWEAVTTTEMHMKATRIQCKTLKLFSIKQMTLKIIVLFRLLSCMPTLQTLSFQKLTFAGDTDVDISSIFKELENFIITDGIISARTLQRLMDSMPLLTKLSLTEVEVEGEMDQKIVHNCKSLTEFNVSGSFTRECIMDANTLMDMLARMPSLGAIYLKNIVLKMLVYKSILGKGLKVSDVHISRSKVDPNALVRIMDCMPLLEKLQLEHVSFSNDLNTNIAPQHCSVKEFRISIAYDTMSLTMLVGLLRYMPLLARLSIDGVDIIGGLDADIKEFCGLLKYLKVGWINPCKFNFKTLIRFLAYMASIESVTLDISEHVGELEGDISAPCPAIEELKINARYRRSGQWKIDINKLLQVLHCMTSLRVLELGKVDITSDFDATNPILQSPIKVFYMSAGRLSTSTFTTLLASMPLVQDVTVGNLISWTGDIQTFCKSLKRLYISCSDDTTLQVNTVVKSLECLPSLEYIRLDRFNVLGELNKTLVVNNENLKTMHIQSCTLSIDTLISLVKHMKRLVRIHLVNVDVNDRFQSGLNVICHQLKDFDMRGGSISASAVEKLLCCMTKLKNLTLYKVTCGGNEMDCRSSSSCELLQEFNLSQSSFSAETLIGLMFFMPFLNAIMMENVEILHDLDSDIPLTFRFLKTFVIQKGTITANTLRRFIISMPSLKELELNFVHLAGELTVDSSVSCKSPVNFTLKNSTRTSCSITPCKMSANTVFGLLGSMELLEAVKLEGVEIVGELDTNIKIGCKLLRDINMKGSSVGANAIMRFMKNIPSLKRLILGKTSGNVDVNSISPFQLLKDFEIVQDENTVSYAGNILMKYLYVMPSLKRVSFYDLQLEEFNADLGFTCKCIQELNISTSSYRKSCTLRADTVFKLSGIMPSLEILTLRSVSITDELLTCTNALQSFESLTELAMFRVSISSKLCFQYLQCMPNLEKLSLENISLNGNFNSNTLFVCKPINTFILSGYTEKEPIRVNMQTFKMMPSLTKLKVEKFVFIGDLDRSSQLVGNSINEIDLSNGTIGDGAFSKFLFSLKSLKVLKLCNVVGTYLTNLSTISQSLQEFYISSVTLTMKLLVLILQRMPSLKKVELFFVCLNGDFPSNVTLQCESLTEIIFFRLNNQQRNKVNANMIVQLLNCMPSLEKVVFRMTNLGELYAYNTLQWITVKEFYVIDSLWSSCTLMEMLKKMPALETLMVEKFCGELNTNELIKVWGSMNALRNISSYDIDLTNEIDEDITCNSVLEFNVKKGKISSSTLMSIVRCMISLNSLSLENVELEGDLCGKSLKFASKLKRLELSNITLKIHILLCILGNLNELETVSLTNISLTDLYSIQGCHNVCKSVKVLLLLKGNIHPNVPIILMSYMPSIEKLTLGGNVTGEIDVNVQTKCEALKTFSILNSKMDINNVVQYLNRMPALEKVILDLAKLEGKMDTTKTITCKSIKTFTSYNSDIEVDFLETVISKQSNLNVLRLADNYSCWLIDEDKKHVISSVESVSSSLKVLQLDEAVLTNDFSTSSSNEITALRACLPNLLELYLSNANMAESQCEKIFELFIEAGERVCCTSTEINEPLTYLPLQWLDLSGSRIKKCTENIMKAFTYLGCLRGLNLCNCNLEKYHFENLHPSISAMTQLEAIDLSQNKGIPFLLSLDFSFPRTLKVLKLCETGLTDEDVVKLHLAQLSSLTELDLSRNPIGTDGAIALVMSLGQKDTSTGGYFQGSSIDSDDSVHASSRKQSPLKKLHLRDCKYIGAKGIERIFVEISNLPNLEELDFTGI